MTQWSARKIASKMTKQITTRFNGILIIRSRSLQYYKWIRSWVKDWFIARNLLKPVHRFVIPVKEPFENNSERRVYSNSSAILVWDLLPVSFQIRNGLPVTSTLRHEDVCSSRLRPTFAFRHRFPTANSRGRESLPRGHYGTIRQRRWEK